jgi:predicted metallo-beta-lactamase superfamily hydrolase
LTFSPAVPHGAKGSKMGTLMMTRIDMNDQVFVHASDIQLLHDQTVDQIIHWQPNIVLAAGPPLYLDRLSNTARNRAWNNAVRLAQQIDVVVLDHHLMRGHEGAVWLEELSAAVGKQIYCAADFMNRPRWMLEAERLQLYEEMPVPSDWHENYTEGKVDPDEYLDAIGYPDTLF